MSAEYKQATSTVVQGAAQMTSAQAPLKAALRDAEKAVRDLEKAIADNNLTANKSSGNPLPKMLEEAKAKAADLKAQLEQTNQKVEEHGQKQRSAEAEIRKTIRAHAEQAAALRTVGDQLSIGVSAPLIAAGAAAVTFAAQFETELNKVRTLAGASATEISFLHDEVLKLAPSVGVAPAELAKGLFSIESASIRGAAAMEVLDRAAKMSALGMGDVQTLARTITAAMLDFGSQGMTAAKAADILVATMQRANIPIDALHGALGRVNAIASSVGISFEQVGAAVATFTHMGVTAAEAVTGLRAIIMNLEAPSARTRKVFDEMGISVSELRDKMKNDLAGTLIDLIDKAGGNIDKLHELIPNVRGLAEAIAIAKQNGTLYVDNLGHIVNSHGILDRAMENTKKTFGQMWKEFTAQVDVAAIGVGEKLLPMLKELIPVVEQIVTALASVVDAFSKLPEPAKTAFEVLLVGAAVGGPILSAIGRIAAGIAVVERGWYAARDAEIAYASAGVGAGGGVGAGAAGAAATAGGSAAEGAGLAALFARLRGVGGAPGFQPRSIAMSGLASALMTGGFLLGNSEMSMSVDQANKELIDFQKEEWKKAILAMIKRKETTGELPEGAEALFPGGLPIRGSKGQGVIAGASFDAAGNLREHADALRTVAERTRELTAAQQEDILTKSALKESTKDIARETGIEASVVATFIRQSRDSVELQRQIAHAKDTVAAMSMPLDAAQTKEAMSLLRINEAAKATILSHQTIARVLGVATVQVDVFAAELKKLDDIEKGKPLTGPLPGMPIYSPKFDINAWRKLVAELNNIQNVQVGKIDTKLLPGDMENEIGLLKEHFNDIKKIVRELKENARELHATLGDLAGAFESVAQASTGSMAEVAHAIAEGIGGIQRGIDLWMQFEEQMKKSGATALSALQMVQALSAGFSSVMGATSSGSPGARAASGALAGAGAGIPFAAMTGGLSIAVGAGIGALVGYLRGLHDEAVKARDAVKELITQFGSIDELKRKAADAGVSLRTIGMAANGDQEALKRLNDALNFQADALKLLDDTLKKYHITLKEMGPLAATHVLAGTAEQLFKEFNVLQAALVPMDVIFKKMGKSFQQMVTDALRSGAQLPSFLQPILEQMIKLGLLTDENGQKLTDLTRISFSNTLKTGIDGLTDAVRKLIDAIRKAFHLPSESPGMRDRPSTSPPIGPGVPRTPTRGAMGGVVHSWGIQPFDMAPQVSMPGIDRVLSLLSEDEWVVNPRQQRNISAALGSGGGDTHVYVDMRGAFVGSNAREEITRGVVAAIGGNKGGTGSRLRGGLQIPS